MKDWVPASWAGLMKRSQAIDPGIPASKRLLLDIAIELSGERETKEKMRKPKEKVISYNQLFC
ncbi:MAG: hypothetical protein ACLT63_14490 [Bacteroides xylanisolvens]